MGSNEHDCVVSGMGVISSIGRGKTEVVNALLAGDSRFALMRRAGRQKHSSFIGAEVPEEMYIGEGPKQAVRTASLTAQFALIAIKEAWDEALLCDVDPRRIGLIVGGSNVQQRELVLAQDSYRDREQYLRPTYALSFMDTDICGFCTERFPISGVSCTVGAASASGQMAILQAANTIAAGQVDVCIAVGALADLSYWECQGLSAIGAMGSEQFAQNPQLACRPFDSRSDGFIFGEACAALIVERAEGCLRRGVRPYARLRGHGVAIDRNRNPNPSAEGEAHAIRTALESASWLPQSIDYVNPHGSGSRLGDATEIEALLACGVTNGYINATKSLLGHGLSAAGAVEVAATLLQMRAGRLHPSRNLENPIAPAFEWVRDQSVPHQIDNALTMSVGFGGINTAICWERCR